MPIVYESASRGGGSGTVTSVTAADTSIVIAGTATDPTVKTGTLDVIAADHPPAADWSNNSKKITSLANGAAAQDAAAFGQIPTTFHIPAGSAVGSNGGNITRTANTFGDVTGISASVAAVAGDILMVVANGTWQFSTTGSTLFFRTITVTGSNELVRRSVKPAAASLPTTFSLSALYTVVSGDISGGAVAVKLQFASDGVNTLTVINSALDDPNIFVVNLTH